MKEEGGSSDIGNDDTNKTSRLILDSEEELVTFTHKIREVTLKVPYKDSELDDLTSEGHALLSSRVIVSDDDVRRGCESPLDLESGFYKDIDKLDCLYKRDIEIIDLELPFEIRGGGTSEGVT
ncbi:hypothetical protein Tco_0783571 [Tanacetum coccineum]